MHNHRRYLLFAQPQGGVPGFDAFNSKKRPPHQNEKREIVTSMMSLASAPVAVAPVRASVSRGRGIPPTAAAGNGLGGGLGAGEGMGAPSARLLRARCRRGVVGVGGRRAVMPVQAKTLEERIASGEFTKPRTSLGENVLNGLRDALKNVESPQSE